MPRGYQSGLRSAYRSVLGAEPEFTNFAFTKDMDKPFVETLDYIFVSEHCKPVDVLRLPRRSDAKGPFPNHSQHSDHVPLRATMELA